MLTAQIIFHHDCRLVSLSLLQATLIVAHDTKKWLLYDKQAAELFVACYRVLLELSYSFMLMKPILRLLRDSVLLDVENSSIKDNNEALGQAPIATSDVDSSSSSSGSAPTFEQRANNEADRRLELPREVVEIFEAVQKEGGLDDGSIMDLKSAYVIDLDNVATKGVDAARLVRVVQSWSEDRMVVD